MATATLMTAVPGGSLSSNVTLWAKRIVNMIAASRARALELELRRHETVLRDLAHRYGHAPIVLNEAEFLPFRL